MTDAPPHINAFWAQLIVDELVRAGVTQFCLSPGSRSTPLVVAAAAHPQARTVVHVDERGSAYFAVGYGRAAGRPAVWITTSGTAAVNGHPAVVEAAQDGIPLICLTADRPPELRAAGANQAIDQVGLFGSTVRWFFDLPTPSETVDPRFVLTTVDHAVIRATAEPGPVHLNCMFREPLAPIPGDWRPNEADVALLGRPGGAYTSYMDGGRSGEPEPIERVAELLRAGRRGLIIVGRTVARDGAGVVLELAEKLGWPVFADVRSEPACRSGHPNVIPYFDPLLANETFYRLASPDVVLALGRPPVSKRLAGLLGTEAPAAYVQVAEAAERIDPDHRVRLRVQADPVAFCRGVADQVDAFREDDRTVALRALARSFEARLETLVPSGELSEPGLVRDVSRLIPEGHGLFLGNSMPVRDMDAFARPGAGNRVDANRGASGIDGTVSAAAGFGAGLGAPVTAVLGDLSVLHDLNGLSYLRKTRVCLVIVNNDGGGIFSFLPIAGAESVFEEFFGTPHGLSFEHAARLFGLPYARPETRAAFETAYRIAVESSESHVIEIRTNRTANRALHVSILDAARTLTR